MYTSVAVEKKLELFIHSFIISIFGNTSIIDIAIKYQITIKSNLLPWGIFRIVLFLMFGVDDSVYDGRLLEYENQDRHSGGHLIERGGDRGACSNCDNNNQV